MRPTSPGEAIFWANAEVTVAGADISGVLLILQPAISFGGRVVMDGRTTPPPPVRILLQPPGHGRSDDPGGRLQLTAMGVALGSGLLSGAVANSRADGSFTVQGIWPGRFDLSVSLPSAAGSGWWLESAVADGRELLDMPLEFGTTLGTIEDAVLTLTNRRTEIVGRLQTPAGLPATDYSVIVFSADRAHWFSGARRTRAVQPATDGVFNVTELPAGAYLVAALTDLPSDDYQRASVLEQLAAFAVPVTVRAGETTRQDLQIAGN
jgi:hypothetical protein